MSEPERGARHLLSQQHPAPVRDAIADRLRLFEQRAGVAPRTSSAWPGASTRTSPRSCFCAGRRRSCARVVEAVLACARAATASSRRMPARRAGARRRRPRRRPLQLSLLAQATMQTIERYYLVIAQLVQAGSGADHAGRARGALPAHRAAHRAAVRSEFTGILRPDHVRELHRPVAHARRDPQLASAGKLEFDEVLMRVAADAQFVLSEQLRHSILQVMHA